MNQKQNKKLNQIKKNFPFKINNEQARAILNEKILLNIEKEQILEEYDILDMIPTPQTFYSSEKIKKDFYQLPAKIWTNQKTPISENYNLGSW